MERQNKIKKLLAELGYSIGSISAGPVGTVWIYQHTEKPLRLAVLFFKAGDHYAVFYEGEETNYMRIPEEVRRWHDEG